MKRIHAHDKPEAAQQLLGRRRVHLFRCIAACFVLATPACGLAATTWAVNTCVDDVSGDLVTHTGSLRFATNNAASGDIVDASSLQCIPSTISLQMGAIAISQDDLTLIGPGADQLLISRSYDVNTPLDRIFAHTGKGKLTISGVSVANGYVSTTNTLAKGGCIYSLGDVYLDHTNVSSCQAKSSAFAAWGGGVYSKGDLTAQSSTISNNTVDAHGYAIGGGAMTFGTLTLGSSSLNSNSAVTSSSVYAAEGGGANTRWFSALQSTISNNMTAGSTFDTGGGIYAMADVTLVDTTISGNTASFGGGISQFVYYGYAKTAAAHITNSTISGNHADYFTGGMVSSAATFVMQNSTVAFNTAKLAILDPDGHYYGPTNMSPGLALLSSSYNKTSVSFTLQSSILSNNSFGPTGTETDGDVSLDGASAFVGSSANNLIRTTFPANMPIPPGVVASSSCPLLGPLRDNGGPTFTHALASHSPAIDSGNDIAIDPSTSLPLTTDQRGLPRVDNGIADIGAYEVQQADTLFNSSFEGCP